MTTGGNSPHGMMGMLEQLSKMPSPEALFKELQRTNDILQRLQPDISMLANAMNKLDTRDVRNLTTALQGIDVSKMLLALNEANSTIKSLYEKLWGKK